MDRRSYSKGALLGLVASLACLLGAAAAQANDRIYWGEDGMIAFSDVDGSKVIQALDTRDTEVHEVEGAAIDPVTNRIYWVDRIGNQLNRRILFASLNGSGGGELNIAGAEAKEATGLAIDPVGRKIYWGGRSSGNIGFAHLDGSGGGNLGFPNTEGFPSGVAIDPVARRIYWINTVGSVLAGVAYANLDGPGGGRVVITGATWDEPHGAAIDPVNGRIYWADRGGDVISFAKFDGTGGGDLNTAGATVSNPFGIAVDPVAGRVYWANRNGPEGGEIAFANSDGSGGGGKLFTRRFDDPQFPLLLHTPKPTAPPAISGSSGPGSQLTCSTGTWAEDVWGAFFWRSPQRFAYQWSRNGADLPGATGPTLATGPAGEYRCRVTAINAAGPTSQTTPPHRVAPAPGSLTLSLAARKTRPGALRVAIRNTGPVDVSGLLSGRAKVKPAGKPRRFAKLAGQPFQLAPGASTVIRLPLPKPARLQLLTRRALAVELAAAFAAPDGPEQSTQGAFAPRLLLRKAK